jgi:hypothetical protein
MDENQTGITVPNHDDKWGKTIAVAGIQTLRLSNSHDIFTSHALHGTLGCSFGEAL